MPPARSAVRPARPGTATFVNPVLDRGADSDHGDPFVLEYLGEYVLYHSGPQGIDAYRSNDLVHWHRAGTVLRGGGPGHWAQVELWAPEVVRQGGEFVMYVAATVRGGECRDAGKAHGADGGDDSRRRQGVATASTPLGPFRWDDAPLVDEWSIDGHPFVDLDGSAWLFYNVRTDATRYADGTRGTGNVVDRILPDGSLARSPVPVAFPDQRWEGDDAGSHYWNEGPVVLRRGDRVYQMYSGGFFGGDGYSIGCAVADAPAGPWRKPRTTPLFTGGSRIRGTGHHSVVLAPDGVTPYAVYHGFVGEGFGRKVHLDRLYWSGDGPRIGSPSTVPAGPTEGSQPVPPAASFDPDAVPFTRRAWVVGTTAWLAGLQVELSGATPVLLEARHDGSSLTLLREGVIAARRPGPARPVLAGGHVVHQVLTSHLDDPRRHVLDAGDARLALGRALRHRGPGRRERARPGSAGDGDRRAPDGERRVRAAAGRRAARRRGAPRRGGRALGRRRRPAHTAREGAGRIPAGG